MGGGEGLSRAAKKRAKKKYKKRQQEDSPHVIVKKSKSAADEDEILDDDQEEEVDMKQPAAVEPKVVVTEVPKSCKSLREILVLDDASADLFHDMTSRQRAHCALEFLLQNDITVSHFYQDYWEQKALLIRATNNRQRLDGFLSLSSIRDLVHKENHPLYYVQDLNVTRYEKGTDGVRRRVTMDKRTDENDPQVVQSSELWKYWDQGCTIRLLCPHQHSKAIHSLLSLLELEWGCMVGSNAYLTPAHHAQGFAPHYDDIEAFILQLEGRKQWKVYEPTTDEVVLPRTSSRDFVSSELPDKPFLDVVLDPGDVLYIPRGWIHQACTLLDSSEHSLHLTVSAMQQWAWADLLETLLPEAMETAIDSDASLRQGLPLRFLEYMGAMHDNRDVPEQLKAVLAHDNDLETTETRQLQEGFRAMAKSRIMNVAKHAIGLVDAACDQMGKRFLSERVPPALLNKERQGTSLAQTTKVQMMPDDLCRLARPGIARLVLENDKAVLYHCGDNSLVYHEVPLSPMEFEPDDAPAIEQLLNTTEPHWIAIADLIHDTIEDKVGVAQALFDEGILTLRKFQQD